ncbi:MAG: hypothetical protein O8C61_03220 [Candidatus Methanoperedens sp.]|nr:hypothetical protein [Candidatus Methanoperedens sp.]
MQLKEFLIKKIKMLALISFVMIGDVFPIICVMLGLWIVKSAARFFGFEELYPIMIVTTLSEIFMIILYIATVVIGMKEVYKLFKEEK